MQRVLRLPCTSPSVLWRRPGELHLQCQGHHCHWHHCQNHHCHCLPLTLVSLSPSSLCHLKIINVFSSCWNKPYPIYEVVTILRCLHLKQVLLTVTPFSSSPRQCHYHHIDPKNGQLWQNLIWSCELCQTSGAKWKKLKELEPHEEARRKNGRFLNSSLASS